MPVTAPAIHSGSRRKGLTAWHTFLCFAAFFAFMFVVNGIFVWTAITTFPGEDIEKSYLAGLDYNDEIARRARQEDLGWKAQIGLSGTGSETQVRAHLSGPNGEALVASNVQVELRHPADRNLDRALQLMSTGGGGFVASAAGLPSGHWNARLHADIDPATEGAEFQASKSLLVP